MTLVKARLPIPHDLLHPLLWEHSRNQAITGLWLARDNIIIGYGLNNTLYVYHQSKWYPVKIRYIADNERVWRSFDCFEQNNLQIRNQIHKYVCSLVVAQSNNDYCTSLCGIGGEFYYYFVKLREHFDHFHGFTNNANIRDLAEFNVQRYSMLACVSIIDYNAVNLPSHFTHNCESTCIINLTRVNLHLLEELVTISGIKYLIFIVCDQDSFNKRRSILFNSGMRLQYFRHWHNDIPKKTISVYYFIRHFL